MKRKGKSSRRLRHEYGPEGEQSDLGRGIKKEETMKKLCIQTAWAVLTVAFLAAGRGLAADPVYCFATPTGDSYSILVSSAKFHGGRGLDVGDEICFWDGELLVGGCSWEGTTPVGGSAWEDDLQTTPVDGFVCGNTIGFSAYDVSTGETFPLKRATFIVGDGTFCNGPFAQVELSFGLRRFAVQIVGDDGHQKSNEGRASMTSPAPESQGSSWGRVKTLFR
jgi:hypothetical protein